MRKGILIGVVGSLLFAAGAAGSGYLITRTGQIKPSVRRALKGNRGPRGRTGPQGAPGAPGAPGTAGQPGGFSTGNVMVATGTVATMGPGQAGASIAYCPAGATPISGGWDGLSHPPVQTSVAYNRPVTGGWEVIMGNSSSITVTFEALGMCAVPTAGQAASVPDHRAGQKQAARDLATVRARMRRR